MLVTLITCTGHRPEALKLCGKYVAAQTYKDTIQWIVVDDALEVESAPVTKGNITVERYKGPEAWVVGKSTHKANMLLALSKVKGDKVLIIEDDDYYAPGYVQRMVSLLDAVDVAGESNATYYHVRLPGIKRMQNFTHASMAQTAFKISAVSLLKSAIHTNNPYFDIEFWTLCKATNTPAALFSGQNLCIGMKGLPGRPGIGIGHDVKGYMRDPGMTELKKLCGQAADNYVTFIKEADVRRDPIRPSPKREAPRAVPVGKPVVSGLSRAQARAATEPEERAPSSAEVWKTRQPELGDTLPTSQGRVPDPGTEKRQCQVGPDKLFFVSSSDGSPEGTTPGPNIRPG